MATEALGIRRQRIGDAQIDVAVWDEDRVFDDALFLRNHPAWTPRDLAEANEELIETMVMIDSAVGEARQREAQRAGRGQSRAAQLAAQMRGRR